MCVFNVTKDDKVPKNFYLDIYELKRLYNDYVSKLNSYDKYKDLPYADTNGQDVTAIGNNIRDELNTFVENICVSIKKKVTPFMRYAKDVIDSATQLYNTMDDIQSHDDVLDTFKELLKEFIDLVNINNYSTPIGTLTFVDELSKYNQTNINCRLDTTSISEKLEHKNIYEMMYSVILEELGGGDIGLPQIYSSNQVSTHRKSKHKQSYSNNKTYKQYK